jgi:CelD/BcsL family acetyltransferase involved in cellulose biosynthesis
MGAAAVEPKPAFSTTTASTTVGASMGAAAMYSEWSRLCSSSLAALYFSPAFTPTAWAVPVLPPLL